MAMNQKRRAGEKKALQKAKENYAEEPTDFHPRPALPIPGWQKLRERATTGRR